MMCLAFLSVNRPSGASSRLRLWLSSVICVLIPAAIIWADAACASSEHEKVRATQLSAQDREVVAKALARANIKLENGVVRPLTPIRGFFFLGSLAEPLARHLVSLVSWQLVERNLTEEQAADCRKLLTALVEWRDIYSLEPAAQAYDQINSDSAIANTFLAKDFLDDGLRDVLHKWVTARAASIDALPDAETVARMYGRSRYGRPGELFNFGIYRLWQNPPYGVSFHNRIHLVHLEGLPYLSTDDLEAGVLPLNAALYLSGSKYLLITCDSATYVSPPNIELPATCVVLKIVYSPLKNYSYVDDSATIAGIQLIIGVVEPDYNSSTSGTPWLIEVFATSQSDPRLLMYRLAPDGQGHDCAFNALPGARLPKIREIMQ